MSVVSWFIAAGVLTIALGLLVLWDEGEDDLDQRERETDW